jgi:cytochrome c oxidase assembly protein subunit 11
VSLDCLNITDIELAPSARRNTKGQLEPDAAETEVQNSLGFGGYENAPKAEVRNAESNKTEK